MKQKNGLDVINDILFGSNEKEYDDEMFSDINVYRFFDYQINKHSNSYQKPIFEILNHNKENYSFNYNYNDDEYIEQFYSNIYDANYYSSGFNKNYAGLERSQLKTLCATRRLIRDNNKYISINGGPGTGKSTLLSYILSNILIDNLLLPYWSISKKIKFIDYLRSNHFKKLAILATGSTVASVENIIDLCKIDMPKEHIWFKQEIYDNFMNRLDYCLIDDNNNDIELMLNKYFWSDIDKRKSYFTIKCKEYFDLNNIYWESIPQQCYERICYNCKLISSINKSIKDIVERKDDEIINEYINEIKLNNCLNKIIKNFQDTKINDDHKKAFLEDYRNVLNKVINDIQSMYKNNNDKEINELITKIKLNIDKLFDIGKIKLFLTSFKKIKDNITNIKELLDKFILISSKKISSIIKIINESIQVLRMIFDDKQLEDMGLIDFIDINLDKKLKSNDLLTIVSSFKILQMNFNIIQKKIDEKIRAENSYLLRHIQEWLFLDSNASDLSYIWPIVSSNIQKYSYMKINRKYWNLKHFDFAIIDESGQTNLKYLYYLNSLSNKIIAVGDINQLQTINDDKQLNIRINNIKKNIDDKLFKLVIDYLVNKLKIILVNGNQYEFTSKSLLEEVNSLSNVSSIINDKQYDGLYLLEHFRCPNQIFNLINKYYYDNMLNCPIKDDYTECVISRHVGNNICCDECSLIQIKYKYDTNKTSNNGKLNYFEIEIGLNLIIDNINLFIKHFDSEFTGYIKENHLKYLIKNIAFVTLYKDQATIIKTTIKDIIEKLKNHERTCNDKNINEITNNIVKKIRRLNYKNDDICEFLYNMKFGTIDSLQGIGCDFVIFSNVSESFKENEFRSSFEFNPNRINVLWTRTKKHFIHIISDNYWTNKSDISCSLYSSRFQAEVTSNNNINRISLNIKDSNCLELDKLFISKKYDFTNKMKISEIGKYGEMILESIMTDREMKQIFVDKVYDDLGLDLSQELNFEWVNKNNESYLEYDYVINSKGENYYLDVKSSIKNSSYFYLSNKEFDFIKNNINKYIILKINDISKYNINVKNKSCLSFAIKNISSYLYNQKLKRFKNLKTDLFYKLREQQDQCN